jgi:succinate dehydrogenase / fumarate reductase flavoprotein subunit
MTTTHSTPTADTFGMYTVGDKIADAKAPDTPIETMWTTRKFDAKLVNPSNRRKLSVIIVGTGLAGGAAAATSARPATTSSRSATRTARAGPLDRRPGWHQRRQELQGATATRSTASSTTRSRVVTTAPARPTSTAWPRSAPTIIDQCVAQGVPFAREYGGLLDNRSFGGVQVSRTFYARGQTGQQLLIGAYQALERQVAKPARSRSSPATRCSRSSSSDGRARGIIARDLVTGEIETHLADAVVLASGGYGNVFFLSTNAMGCNVTASWRAHRKGAYMANPCYTQIHPTCIPVSGDHQSKLTLMSESLRNDGRIWVPKRRRGL